jgi:hypothetical protein
MLRCGITAGKVTPNGSRYCSGRALILFAVARMIPNKNPTMKAVASQH